MSEPAVRACTRTFDPTTKTWRMECAVFEAVTEASAPAATCPTCSRPLPRLSPPHLRMVRGENDDRP